MAGPIPFLERFPVDIMEAEDMTRKQQNMASLYSNLVLDVLHAL